LYSNGIRIADDFFFLIWQNEAGNTNFQNISWNESLSGYLCSSFFLGAVILQMGADSISKLMQQKMGKDRWNVEEESFDQNQELIKSDTISIFLIYSDTKEKAIKVGLI
jgi:hypothetical protein